MRRGFTLIELLVVIGIIALLISIVLPAMGLARSRMRQLTCAAQLREIGAALVLQSSEHDGFMQMACEVGLPPGTIGRPLPPQIQDAQERRYVYGPERGVYGGFFPRHLASLQDSLLPYVPADVFRCPDDEQAALPRVSTTYVVDNVRHITGDAATYSSYAANATVFGFDHDNPTSPRRLAGKVSRIGDPSRHVMLADCDPTSAEATFWSARLDIAGEVVFDDVVIRPFNLSYAVDLDETRHRARRNALMADGHVESAPVSTGPGGSAGTSALLQRRMD